MRRTRAIENYERPDHGAFFEPERPRQNPEPRDEHERDRETLDHEVGLAEITALTAGEIDLTEHPSGEIPVDSGATELLAGLEHFAEPHSLAAAIEITRLAADEFGGGEPRID
ncbi:MAG: hypothetical protein WD926_01825 [Patescibacteria group bacterium]